MAYSSVVKYSPNAARKKKSFTIHGVQVTVPRPTPPGLLSCPAYRLHSSSSPSAELQSRSIHWTMRSIHKRILLITRILNYQDQRLCVRVFHEVNLRRAVLICPIFFLPDRDSSGDTKPINVSEPIHRNEGDVNKNPKIEQKETVQATFFSPFRRFHSFSWLTSPQEYFCYCCCCCCKKKQLLSSTEQSEE